MYYLQSVEASEDHNLNAINEIDTDDSDDKRHKYTHSLITVNIMGGWGSICELLFGNIRRLFIMHNYS